jgi:hypothetical protein
MFPMKYNDNYLRTFELCRFELGYNKVALFDFERGNVYNLPKTSVKAIKMFYQLTGKQIAEKYPKEFHTIEEYYNFFLEKEICFELTNKEKKMFPNIDESWDYPSMISNIHLIIDEIVRWEKLANDIFDILINHNVQAITIEYHLFNENDFMIFLEKIQKSCVIHIELIIVNGSDFQIEHLNNLSSSIFKINVIYIYNWNCNDQIITDLVRFQFHSISIQEIRNQKKENFHPFFNLNLLSYWESKDYNLYYNRKVIIQNNWIIENIETQTKIASLDLLKQKIDSINELNEAITKNWFISKNKIDVCCECEFKRVCMDDRILINRKDGSYYSLNECDYNPFISKWRHESNFLTLKDCGVFVSNDSYSVDQKKIYLINQEIYGD